MPKPFILIAEDDVEDLMIIRESFKELNQPYELHFLENGVKLLDYLAGLTPETLPTLIILDLNMPLMNGTETLRKLREQELFAHIPIMMFSTSVNEIEKAECIKLGAANYITKPSTYKEGIDIAAYFYELASKGETGLAN